MIFAETSRKRTILAPALTLLWFLAWASTPTSVAVDSMDAVSGYAVVKAILRGVIAATVLLLLLVRAPAVRATVGDTLRLPVLYVILNVALLPLAAAPFYSGYRIVEFVLVWATAALIAATPSVSQAPMMALRSVFRVMTFICAVLIGIYLIAPEWGAKVSGIARSGEVSTRLGGSVLRVDLAAVVGASVFLFWMFTDASIAPLRERALGCFLSGTVIILTHSRTTIYGVIALSLIPLLSRRMKTASWIAVTVLIVGGVAYLDTTLNFLMRGSDIRELATMNGRLDLWPAVLNANTRSSITLGNGYLMNSPNGLEFFVPRMWRFMQSPHNGYLSVLLGSGILGLGLVIAMHWRFFVNARRLSAPSDAALRLPLMLIAVYLMIQTCMDYGIWGVTSPAMLLFAIMYLTCGATLARQS